MVPDDLRQRLLEFVPAPPAPELATLAALPTHVAADGAAAVPSGASDPSNDSIPLTYRDTEIEALADLPTVLRLVAQGALSVSAKTARPTAAAMRALSGHLSGGDFYPPESRQPGSR
jgi:hypothetical protein